MDALKRGARQVAIVVGGSVLLLAGVVLLVLPGPGIPLIFAGLALLGTQFPWARRTLHWGRDRARSAFEGLRARVQRSRSSAAAPRSARPSGG